MADPIDFTSTLQSFAAENQGKAVPFQAAAKVSGEDSQFNDMLTIFQQAFPDMDFEKTPGGIQSKPKVSSPTSVGISVPDGYSPKLADAGIRDFTTALEKAVNDEDKFNIAVKLNQAVQTQKAYRFGEYKSRAEAEFGVPDILNAIERIKQAEMASPYNPGNGLPSAQRMQLMTSLITARTHAANRIKDFMENDPELSTAENLAKSTITQIEGSLRIEGRNEILDEKRRKKIEREAQIRSLDPTFVDNIQIIKFGKIDAATSISVREQIIDGKIKLSETERLLATANDDIVKDFYGKAKDPKDKAMALTLLQAKEEAITGDKEQAKRNIEFFKTIMNSDLADANNKFLTPAMRQRWKQANTEVTAQSATSNRSKDEMLSERGGALKREMMAEAVKVAFYSDVSKWNGLMKSDEVAQALIRQAGGKEKLSVSTFVDRYLAYNDGRDMAAKSKAIQAIIGTASAALPRSAVLPIPSEESVRMEAQRITAQRTQAIIFNQAGRTWSTAIDSLFGGR